MSSIHGIDHPNSGMRKRSVIAATLVAVSGIGALGASGGHGCSRAVQKRPARLVRHALG
jgi:hypothetical protein